MRFSFNKEKVTWLILSIIIISVVTLLPIIKPLSGSINKTIETIDVNKEAIGRIIKGTKIEQKICIPKGLKQFGVIFATYAKQNYGHIDVKIEQGEISVDEVIDISTLQDNQLYMFKMNMSKLKNGEAKLIITGIDGDSENSVTVYGSEDTSLGKMSLDGNELNKGIMQKFTFNEFDLVSKVSIICSIILIFLICVVIYILNFKEEDRKNSIKLFLCTIIINILILNIKAPILTFAVEPFAELANNFYINGEMHSALGNMLIPDAGYLPLLQRIVSVFVIKVLHSSPIISIYLMQGFAIVFIASISSLFCLKEFSEYGNRLFRFTVAVVLGSCAIVYIFYDSHSFINFTYYGIIWVILMSMLDFNDVSKKKFISIAILTSIICISKSYYVVLIPIVVFMYIVKRNELSRRYKCYLGSIFCGSLIQLIYTIRNIQEWVKPDEKKQSLLGIIQKSLYNLVQQVINIFYPNIANVPDIGILNISFIVAIIIFIIISIYYIYILKNNKNLVLMGLILLVSGTSMFNVVTTVWNKPFDWFNTQGAILMRHSIFIQIGLIFILVFTIYIIRQIYENTILSQIKIEFNTHRQNFRWVYFLMAFVLASRFTIFDNKNIQGINLSFSDWKVYSSMLKNDNYVVPIDPYPWMLSKNCDICFVGNPNIIPKEVGSQIKERIDIDNKIRQIHEVKLDKKLNVLSVFTKRLRVNSQDKLLMIGYNEKDEPVTKTIQVNESGKIYIGFILDGTKEICKISFFNENMEPAYISPEIIIGSIK